MTKTPDYIAAEMAAQSLASHCAQMRAFAIVSANCTATTKHSEAQALYCLEQAAEAMGYGLHVRTYIDDEVENEKRKLAEENARYSTPDRSRPYPAGVSYLSEVGYDG